METTLQDCKADMGHVHQSTPSIAVVMSTYNGAAHLVEQLESVLAQDVRSRAHLSVFVRDDGSHDTTVELLREYERRGSITLLRGENLGVVGSFLAALASVPSDIDYVALCDQDDVWHTNKLSRALEVLAGCDNTIPQLYWSEYMFCDSEMHPQKRSHHNQIGVSFPTMLYEVMTSGNTLVMNRVLADLASTDGSTDVYCHDWWLALLASSLGGLVYDDFVSLDYRRTGSNASPTGGSPLTLLRYRVKSFLAGDQLGCITKQLARLRELHGDELSQIAPERRALLDLMLDGGRFRKAFVPVRLRQHMMDELALRMLFLLGRL